MPELWLRYGSTEVVLDIRAENLLDYVTWETENLSEEQIGAALDSISVEGSAQVAVLDNDGMLAKLSSALVERLAKRGVQIGGLYVPGDVLNRYRSAFQEKGIQTVSKIPSDPAKLSGGGGGDDIIFLSRTSFDPLFGYSGAPSRLLRHFAPEAMLEAYRARSGKMPEPGSSNNALAMAQKFAEGFGGTSIEAVPGSRGVAEIVVDKPVKAHQAAIAKLESLARVEVEKSKACITSPGSSGPSTLAGALNSLWNCMGAVREEGSITLLAECRDGFGSLALERLVEGKLDFKDARNPQEYVDGLEDLLYLGEMGSKYDLMLITTLPDYYVKKILGFKTFRKIKDALHHILNIHGPRQKVLVVSDSSRILLKPKRQNR
ncbi:MAG: hypothetical protein ACE5JV_02000 [Nitrososphaerales archaeon]